MDGRMDGAIFDFLGFALPAFRQPIIAFCFIISFSRSPCVRACLRGMCVCVRRCLPLLLFFCFSFVALAAVCSRVFGYPERSFDRLRLWNFSSNQNSSSLAQFLIFHQIFFFRAKIWVQIVCFFFRSVEILSWICQKLIETQSFYGWRLIWPSSEHLLIHSSIFGLSSLTDSATNFRSTTTVIRICLLRSACTREEEGWRIVKWQQQHAAR